MKELSFVTFVRKNGLSFVVTIPKNKVVEEKIKIGEVWLVSIDNKEFPMRIRAGGNGNCYQFVIPKHLTEELKLEKDSKIKITFKSKLYTKDFIRNKNNSSLLPITQFLPNRTSKNKALYLLEKNNKVLVWIPSCKYWLEIPYYLPTNNETFEFFGLVQGDGYKKFSRGSYLGFSNSSPNVIITFLNSAEKLLNIPREYWIAEIVITIKNLTKNKESKLISYWSKITRISKNKISVIKNLPKSIKTKSSPYGTFYIRFTSEVAGEIIVGILKNLYNYILKNPDWLFPFLRGLFAADALPVLTKSKSLNRIFLTYENDEELKFYEKLFKSIRFKYFVQRKKRNISISGWNQFFEFFQKQIFILNPERQSIFCTGFINNKRTKTLLKYLDALKERKLESRDLAEMLKLDISTTRKVCNKFVNVGYISKEENDRITYIINERGKSFLKLF